MNNAPILVIGSTGKTGRRIAARLAAKGHAVREGSRRSDPAFDWQNPSTWPRALEGAEAVFISFFPDLAVPEAPAMIEKLTACARAAGVQRLVLLSGRGEANAQRCEDIVRGCGVSATCIRASWFAQNFDEGELLEPVLCGTVALPAGNVLEPFIDVEDIADVAVAALTESGHAGRLYEITGPRLLTFADAVGEIADAAGREIRYAQVSVDQYTSMLADAQVPDDFASLLTYLFTEVLDGRNARVTDGVEQALGRAPRDFSDYARSAAATGVWDR